jgi:hypothetical protein
MGNVALEGFGSGGAGVNFKIVGGTTQPTTTRENTIWVNTDTAISGWVFSATEPTEPAAGMVWLTVGTSSSVAFNALKKNGLQVYPISALQYIGSEWTAKTAKSYIGGKWADWWNGELYKSGKEFAGWAYVPMALNSFYKDTNAPTIDKGATSMKIAQTAYTKGCAYVYNDEVDLTAFDTLNFDGVLSTSLTSISDSACLCIWTSLGTYVADNRVAYINFNTASPKKIDVTALTGKHRIGFFIFSSNTYAEVNSLLLE